MTVDSAGPALTYCLNVHPGESWEEQWQALRQHALPIGRQVSPGHPFGLGLRLSARSAAQLLANPPEIERTRAALREANAYALSVNAFPYGTFHGTEVKDRVYQPDWADPRRVAYTLDVARVMARLAPEGAVVSVSTAPLSFKGWATCRERAHEGLRHVVQVAQELARIQAVSGREIVLAMEPEPHCFPETTDEVLDVMTSLWAEGRRLGVSEDVLRQYIGVCFDTAHQAVEFEDLAESLLRLREAGVRIAKVQLSAAIEADTRAGRQALEAFAEPTYLHQVAIRDRAGHVRRYSDLSDALSGAAWHAGDVWRVHYHVPLFTGRFSGLHSTSARLSCPAFRDALAASGCPHLEIETYTWQVWQQDTGDTGSIDEGIAREFAWVREHVLAGRVLN